MSEHREPIVIGWTEFVDLPEWGVKRLRAKVDTGARTSALHVENIEELPRGFVSFDVVLHRKKRDRRIRIRAKVSRRGRVRSSTGHLTTRLFVETTLRLGPVEKRVEVSLVDREKMIHRMLLGRAAISGPFLVDVDRRMATRARKKKARKKKVRKKVKA
ncbi:MAG: ATP-dependent zinc protease [Myxococcota bacterium]